MTVIGRQARNGHAVAVPACWLLREERAALGDQLLSLKRQILEFDRMIMAWHRSNQTSKRLSPTGPRKARPDDRLRRNPPLSVNGGLHFPPSLSELRGQLR
jgi:hypothetical protein